MAVHDNASGPGGFGLGGSGDDPNRNQPGAFPPDPNGVEPMRPTRTKAGQHNRNSQFGVQAGQEIQAGGMLELAQRLRQDFVQLQQDLAQERQARMQLEGRVNVIQQQLQQDVQVSSSDSSTSEKEDNEEMEGLRKRLRDAQARAREQAEMREAIRAQQEQLNEAVAERFQIEAEMDRERKAQVAQVARTFRFVIGWALLAWYASGLVN